MAFFRKSQKTSDENIVRSHPRIRTRLFTIFSLLLVIMVLFAFLINYSGFTDWERIDTNLTIFVAVNVNIVLLTTVFYMLLRNLFKLIYERKKPFAGVRLKSKLIIAFVALSLPSTAFHLMTGGFMAFLFENWSSGEYKQVLDGAQSINAQLRGTEEKLLRLQADGLLAYLPRTGAGYAEPDWLKGYLPGVKGGIFIYGGNHSLLAQWVPESQTNDGWAPASPDRFRELKPQYWRIPHSKGDYLRLLLPLPQSPEGLWVEVLERSAPGIAMAQAALTNRREQGQLFGRDLATLTVTFLIVMTLLIIFAATWIAFYLARGFVAPIEHLDDATRRVAEGELGYQVERSAMGPLEPDFKRLVRSFNSMSRQLNEQNLQLLKTTGDLRTSSHTLGERNRLVELLLENIDAGIVSLDPQGNITALNRTAKRLVQPRLENWENRHYLVVFDKEVVDPLEKLLEAVRAGERRQVTQNLTLTLNRKTVIVEMTLLGLDDRGGQPEGNIVLLKDVSAMQRNQRALAWGEVARRVAHEIKNPLTPIQLSAQRLRRRYQQVLNKEGDILDQCTQTIIQEVSSLKKMVNEFSQFAQLPESKPLPDNINSVIEEVGRFFENGIPDKVKLDMKLAKNLPDFPIDREQMRRVFTNLLDNAVSAVNGGGTITITTGMDDRGKAVTVEVMDDGQGVPDEIRSRMFEPYTSTKDGGTGLGLTIVNQIVSDHNGYIRYSDRKPRGTIFSMEFRLQ